MENERIFTCILLMAGITYLVRLVPMVLCKKQPGNPFIRAFLRYVPYSILSAMTFPAALYSTDSVPAACVGLLTALVLSYKNAQMIVISLGTTGAAFLTAQMLQGVM